MHTFARMRDGKTDRRRAQRVRHRRVRFQYGQHRLLDNNSVIANAARKT
jgi:hypothetical protein